MAQGGSCGVRTHGKTIIREREEPMVRWRRACHIPTRHNINMALRHRGEHGDNFGVQCGSAVRKTGLFTHVRGNLRGDVSGKRFSTHVGEGNVADVAQERLSDGTGCTDTWHCHVGPVSGHCYVDTSTGYCHRVQSQDTATNLCHG